MVLLMSLSVISPTDDVSRFGSAGPILSKLHRDEPYFSKINPALLVLV